MLFNIIIFKAGYVFLTALPPLNEIPMDDENFDIKEYEIQTFLDDSKKKLTVVIDCDKEIDPQSPDDIVMALEAYTHQLIRAIKQRAITKTNEH